MATTAPWLSTHPPVGWVGSADRAVGLLRPVVLAQDGPRARTADLAPAAGPRPAAGQPSPRTASCTSWRSWSPPVTTAASARRPLAPARPADAPAPGPVDRSPARPPMDRTPPRRRPPRHSPPPPPPPQTGPSPTPVSAEGAAEPAPATKVAGPLAADEADRAGLPAGRGPRRTVSGATPTARATTATPPAPSSAASAPNHSRR